MSKNAEFHAFHFPSASERIQTRSVRLDSRQIVWLVFTSQLRDYFRIFVSTMRQTKRNCIGTNLSCRQKVLLKLQWYINNPYLVELVTFHIKDGK